MTAHFTVAGKSRGIRLVNNDLSAAGTPVKLGEGVPADAVAVVREDE